MAELLACPKLPDTRRRSGSATIAMPGRRSAVIQRLATAGAAAGMMERPTHHLFVNEISSTRRVASKTREIRQRALRPRNPERSSRMDFKRTAHPYLTSAKRGARSGSEGQGAARAPRCTKAAAHPAPCAMTPPPARARLVDRDGFETLRPSPHRISRTLRKPERSALLNIC